MMNYKICGIYSITNPNGEKYIGSSKCIKMRWNSHRFSRGGHPKLNESKQKYGIENHVFEILVECHPIVLIAYEAFYQREFNTVEKGLNYNYADTSPRKGEKHKVSSNKKNRLAHLGKTLTQEHKEKIGNALRGIKKKPMSEETKRRVSESKKGVKLNLSDKQREERKIQLSKCKKVNSKKVLCTQTNKVYNSIAEASRENNINEQTLRFWLNINPLQNKSSLILIK